MTIFENNLKRLYRDKFTLIIMLVMPIIFISFSMFALGGTSSLNVAVIDKDNTKLTAIFKDNLQSSASIVELQEEDIKQNLTNDKLDYAIKIDMGFTQKLIQGLDVKLQTYSLKETNTSASIKFFTENFINSSKNIAMVTKGNEEDFYKGMERYLSNMVSADYISIENSKNDTKTNTYISLGFMVMFMLFMSANAATLVLEDKQLMTYSRILSSPISGRSYFIQNLLSYIAIMFIQVFAIFFILVFIFKADMGPSVGSLLILFSIFALTAVALGMAISSFSKDLKQENALSYLITIPMCMLGGSFWPQEIMPKALQQLSNFTPVTWVLNASEKILLGSSLYDVRSELAILLLFTLVFLLIGSNKRIMMKA